MHVCSHCGKLFSSGSSLGGHVARVHFGDGLKKPKTEIIFCKKSCEKCKTEFDLKGRLFIRGKRKGEKSWSKKKFCSLKCANSHDQKGESNEKRKATFQKKKEDKIKSIDEKFCPQCGKQIHIKKFRQRKNKFCSRSCVSTFSGLKPKNLEKFLVVAHRPTSHKAMKGRHGPRADISNEINFKSSWEADFARILMFEKKIWEYEPHTFSLSNGTNYTPDFLIGGLFVEIKNFTKLSSIRHQIFQSDNLTEKFVLIAGEALFYGILSFYSNKILFENEKYVKRWENRKKIDIHGAKDIFDQLKFTNWRNCETSSLNENIVDNTIYKKI